MINNLISSISQKLGFSKLQKNEEKVDGVIGILPSDKVLGNLGDFGVHGSLHEFMVHHHDKYGPLFSFYWMDQKCVSVGSPEYMKAVKRLFDRPPEQFALFEPILGKKSFQYANGEEGKGRRQRYWVPPFKQDIIDGHYFEYFYDSFKNADKIFLDAAQNNKSLNLSQICFEFIIPIILKVGYGNQISVSDIKKIEETYHSSWAEMETRMLGSFPEPGSEREKKFEENMQYFKDFANQCKEKGGESTTNKPTFFNFLQKENNDDIMVSEITTMIIGGTHTSALLMLWSLIFLAQNQDKQELFQQELDEFCKDKEEIDSSTLFKLNYGKLITKESVRLSIMAPWGARVDYENDTKMPGGEIVKKGTPIMLPFGYLHQSKEIWGDNVNEFEPERFKKPLKEALAYQPFGFAGGRICPGMNLAHTEVLYLLACVLRKYSVKLSSDEPIEKVYGLVTSPKKDVFIQFQLRK